jgi:hypothetical protein
MGMNFPDVPINGQVSGPYTWDGEKWVVTPASVLDQATGDARYVNVSGDTMTGPLNIVNGAGRAFTVQGKENPPSLAPTDAYANFVSANGGYGALSIGGRPASPYSAWLQSHNSGGTVLPLEINTAGGNVGIGKTPATTLDVAGNITAAPSATTGTYYFGNSGTKSLSYDGTNFNFVGGSLYAPNFVTALGGSIFAVGTATTGTYNFGTTSTKYLNYDGTNFNLVGGKLFTPGFTSTEGVQSYASAAPTTGFLYLGNTLTKSLSYDGTNFNFVGGPVFAPQLIATGFIGAGNSGTTGTYYFGNTGTKYLNYDGTNFSFAGGAVIVNGGAAGGQLTLTGNVGVNSTFQMQVQGAVFYSIVATSPYQYFFSNTASSTGMYMASGGSAWNAISDERLPYKRSAKPLTVLDKIDAVQLYENIVNDRPDLFIKAQEFQKAFPHLVSEGTGSDAKSATYTPTGMGDPACWGMSYERAGVVALQGLKELKQLVAELRAEIASLKAGKDG